MATAIDLMKSRGAILGFFLFSSLLFGHLSAGWVYEEAFPPHSSVKGGMIHFKSEDRFSKVQATYFHLASGYRLILSLKGDPFTNKENITITADLGGGNTKSVDAHVLKGGYKIAVPKELSQEIANTLAVGKPVSLSFETYKTTLSSDGFKEAWKRFSP